MVSLQVQLTNSTLRGVIKRLHFPLEVMLVCVRWYAAYALSLRNLEEMMAERGVLVDHTTVHRWAVKMLPVLAKVFRRRQVPVGRSWRVDETCVKVAGQWVCTPKPPKISAAAGIDASRSRRHAATGCRMARCSSLLCRTKKRGRTDNHQARRHSSWSNAWITVCRSF